MKQWEKLVESGRQCPRPREGEAAPYHECFEEVDAGAGGDCFFLACAAGLNDKGATKATSKDLGPGGRLQAGLGLLAATELQKAKYKARNEYIKNVGTTGFAADSRAVAATAVGAKAALFIWKFS